jgi:O-antigen/teichoic acid export membrane protein
MSASKRIAIAVGISWVSRAISILSGLLLMPILFRFMGKEELGLWFLLGNSQAFLGLLGMGIAPTLTRRIAFAKGKSGSHPDAELTDESKQDISDWVVTGKVILQWLAIIVFFIAWISGYGLIRELKLEQVSPQTVFWAWTLMCLGYAINVWVAYLGCWLQGIGYVGWDSLIATILAVVTIGANIVAVLMGGGILELAIISVVSGISNCFIFWGFIRWRQPELLTIKGKWNYQYAKDIFEPSLKWWLTDIGIFLTNFTDEYFIAFFLGTDQIPNYRASIALVTNPLTLVSTIASSSTVFISQAWQSGDLKNIHKIVIYNAQLGLSLMASAIAFVLLVNQEFVNVWLGKNNILIPSLVIIICVNFTLKANNILIGTPARGTEDERYALITMLSAFLNLGFTWLLIKPFGLSGVVAGTLIAQLLTTNWYTPYRSLIRLSLPFTIYWQKIISLWLYVFIFSLGMGFMTKNIVISMGLNSDLIIVTSTALVIGIVLFVFLWSKILDRNHKVKLMSLFTSTLKK